MKSKMKRTGIIIASVFLCSIIAIRAVAQEETLKLISYNVYWGMKQDSTENKTKFAEWIQQQDPDILALQEMNGFSQKSLQQFAASYGHPYSIIVKEPAPDGSVSFPVAITSKYPIVNVQRVVDNILHGLIVAEIEGHHFMVTHFHPFSAQARSTEVGLLLGYAKSDPDAKWLLMGDLNSTSPLDKSEYDNGLVLNNIREDMKIKPHNQNLVNNELDYSVQQKILNMGFVDAIKKFHPNFIASAPTDLFYDQSSFPLRYDYLYVSKNMEQDIIKSEIIKDDFTNIYSDHYPVLLLFKK